MIILSVRSRMVSRIPILLSATEHVMVLEVHKIKTFPSHATLPGLTHLLAAMKTFMDFRPDFFWLGLFVEALAKVQAIS